MKINISLKNVLFLVVVFIIYTLNQKLIRPFIYAEYTNQLLLFIEGLLPNYLGSILFYFLLKKILLNTHKEAFIATMVLVLIMETERHYMQHFPFDPYDILASVLGVFTIQLYDCYFNKKTNNSSNSTTYNL